MGIYNSVVPLLKQVIENQDFTTIIDLCSGSGERAIHLKQKMLRDYSIDLDVVLTDKFPNLSKAKEFDHKKDITYFTE